MYMEKVYNNDISICCISFYDNLNIFDRIRLSKLRSNKYTKQMKKKYTDITEGTPEDVLFRSRKVMIQDREGNNIVLALVHKRKNKAN